MGRRSNLRKQFKKSVLEGDEQAVRAMLFEPNGSLPPIGIDYLAERDEKNNNIMHYAMSSSQPDIILFFLNHMKESDIPQEEIRALLNAKNNLKQTPVLLFFGGLANRPADRQGENRELPISEIVSTLLEYHADLGVTDIYGACPLYFAVAVPYLEKETISILADCTNDQLLLKKVKNQTNIIGNAFNYKNNTALPVLFEKIYNLIEQGVESKNTQLSSRLVYSSALFRLPENRGNTDLKELKEQEKLLREGVISMLEENKENIGDLLKPFYMLHRKIRAKIKQIESSETGLSIKLCK